MFRILLSLFLVAFASNAMAQNYAATAGAGLTFGANLVGGVLYPQQNMCDSTTPARCVVVDASGRITLAPNQSVNVAQINGVTVLMGNGATGTGSQRVTLANDNTIPTGWPTAANQAVVTTWAGGTLGAMATYGTSPGAVLVPGVNAYVTNTTPLGQAVMASSSPVVIASNQTANALWGHGATGAAVPANATMMGFNSGGNLTAPAVATPLPVRQSDGTNVAILDPCQTTVNSTARGSIASATTTRIITPSASNKTYICSVDLLSFAANNVAVVEGTGGTCGTGTAGVVGGTTTGTGISFAAQGGLVKGGAGFFVWNTAGTNVDFCLITSTTGPLSYFVKYVQAP